MLFSLLFQFLHSLDNKISKHITYFFEPLATTITSFQSLSHVIDKTNFVKLITTESSWIYPILEFWVINSSNFLLFGLLIYLLLGSEPSGIIKWRKVIIFPATWFYYSILSPSFCSEKEVYRVAYLACPSF